MTMTMDSFISATTFSLLLVSICDGQAVRDNNTDGCSLLMNGQISQALMLTQVGVSSDILVDGAGCAVTLLLVGGGGHDSGYGGAGSGFLKYYPSLEVTPGTVLTARVGGQRQTSSVASSGGDTFAAEPGQDSSLEMEGAATAAAAGDTAAGPDVTEAVTALVAGTGPGPGAGMTSPSTPSRPGPWPPERVADTGSATAAAGAGCWWTGRDPREALTRARATAAAAMGGVATVMVCLGSFLLKSPLRNLNLCSAVLACLFKIDIRAAPLCIIIILHIMLQCSSLRITNKNISNPNLC